MVSYAFACLSLWLLLPWSLLLAALFPSLKEVFDLLFYPASVPSPETSQTTS